ncbi:hypothetical protein QFC24_003937 [Naganishia onofrii]|uniref:Uncharacterized protein n=1 Tax=Naganishia onofrii TaxID=1851511 RepID=A0ACC2XHJ1_9TREE|nr:hypothetical protein QFC24_003937 [Naganishia onofrii]
MSFPKTFTTPAAASATPTQQIALQDLARSRTKSQASLSQGESLSQQPVLTNQEAANYNYDDDFPEGGYGWVIITALFLNGCMWGGLTYSWGVVQLRLVQDKLSSAATLSFIGGVSSACMSIFATLNSNLVRRFGVRNCALVGSMLVAFAQIFSGSTTKNLSGLFVTSGFMMGTGCSILFMVGSILPSQYFKRRRGLANGIVYSGSGIGGAIMSITIEALIQRYGPGWSFRAVGLIALAVMCPSSWMLRERTRPKKGSFLEWRLFRDRKFGVFFCSAAIGLFPLFVAPFFLPMYGTSMGLSPSSSAGLVAGFNLASAVGRISFGQVSDQIGPINALIIALVWNAISLLVIWPVSTSLAPLVVFVISNGMANGGFFALMPTVVGSITESSKLASAMSMLITGWTGGYLMGAPIAGYLLEAFGGENSGLEPYRPA